MCLKLLQDSCSEAMIRLFVFLLNVTFIVVGIVFCITGIWMEIVYAYIAVSHHTSCCFVSTSSIPGYIANYGQQICHDTHCNWPDGTADLDCCLVRPLGNYSQGKIEGDHANLWYLWHIEQMSDGHLCHVVNCDFGRPNGRHCRSNRRP